MGGWCEGEQRGGGPAKEQRDRVREERSHPAEVSFYVAVAVETRIRLSSERAGEEDCKEKKYDPADLAGERGLGRPIVPAPARAL